MISCDKCKAVIGVDEPRRVTVLASNYCPDYRRMKTRPYDEPRNLLSREGGELCSSCIDALCVELTALVESYGMASEVAKEVDRSLADLGSSREKLGRSLFAEGAR